MRILTLAVLLASSAASAADIMTPEALKASPDIVIADDMARCAAIGEAVGSVLKDAPQKDAAAIANLQRTSDAYAGLALFYIKSHFRKNHITDNPEDWVRTRVRQNWMASMFEEQADLQKEMERCDKVDFPVGRDTHGP
jgi:hypothetical protein